MGNLCVNCHSKACMRMRLHFKRKLDYGGIKNTANAPKRFNIKAELIFLIFRYNSVGLILREKAAGFSFPLSISHYKNISVRESVNL